MIDIDADRLKLVLGGSDPVIRNMSAAVERGDYWQRTGWNPTLGTIWGGVADLGRQAVGAPKFEIPHPDVPR